MITTKVFQKTNSYPSNLELILKQITNLSEDEQNALFSLAGSRNR